MRVRAAQGLRPQHPRPAQIARVLRRAGDFVRAIDTLKAALGRAGWAARGGLKRLAAADVACAPAQVAGHPSADLGWGWSGNFIEQRSGRHDLAGRADSALEACPVD